MNYEEEQRSVSAPSPRRGYRYKVGRTQGYSRKRVESLAQPKQPRTIWIRTLGRGEAYGDDFDWRRIFWGDQESLWPLNKATLSANATPRLEELAEPKKNFQGSNSNAEFLYSCGRRSVIWDVPPGAKTAEATPRVQELSKPKANHQGFLEDRQQNKKTTTTTKRNKTKNDRPQTRQGGQRSGRNSNNVTGSRNTLPPIQDEQTEAT